MPSPGRLHRSARRVLLPLLLLGTLGAAAAQAIPLLDLKPFPKAAAGERRWVIQLPGLLPPSRDERLSPDPADWRVELIVGKEMTVDCNGPRLNGRIRRSTLPGSGDAIYRVRQVGQPISTRMACPPDQPRRKAFVPLAGQPTVVPYNASLPIVIYAPRDLQVRWRLWKAERLQQKAQQL